MADDVFLRATREAFRYPSMRGELTTEQLWKLPLIGKGQNLGFDLDSVAREIDGTIEKMGKKTFVKDANNPSNRARSEAEAKLAVVTAIIAVREAEVAEIDKRAAKAEERRKIDEALAAADARDLSSASREELLRRRAALDA